MWPVCVRRPAAIHCRAMSEGPSAVPSENLPAQWQHLWRDILTDLRDVFDVHFVCATFSYHLARHTGASALVAVADTPVSYTHLDVYKRQDARIHRRAHARNGR